MLMLDPTNHPTPTPPGSCLECDTRGSMTIIALLSFALYGLVIGFLIGLVLP